MSARQLIDAALATESDDGRRELLVVADEVQGDIEIAERLGSLPPASLDALRGTVADLLAELGLK